MITYPAPESLVWTTSSFSDGGANCVMVGRGVANIVGVRDSKAPDMPAIMFSVAAWSRFLDAVKAETTDDGVIASPQDKTDLYALDLSDMTWRGALETNPADRVETAHLPAGAIALRHPATKTTLRYTHAEWIAFVRGVQAREFEASAAA
ncbi:DUF397 domain-containing protein [Streptosporangium canum]|uniref:DUF397 domain-containing protein n=1 Tax=Streptosporangium canum TaxID=324952 RepID=UPI0036AA15A3